MIEGPVLPEPDPDPYLVLTDPDPEGPRYRIRQQIRNTDQ